MPKDEADVNGGHSANHEYAETHHASGALAGESVGKVPMVRVHKAKSIVWLLSHVCKLAPLPDLLPCAFASDREMPLNRQGVPVSRDATNIEHIAIKEWYAYAMSDVNLPMIGPERTAALRRQMPGITLRDYQKQSVQWMLARELGNGSLNDCYW